MNRGIILGFYRPRARHRDGARLLIAYAGPRGRVFVYDPATGARDPFDAVKRRLGPRLGAVHTTGAIAAQLRETILARHAARLPFARRLAQRLHAELRALDAAQRALRIKTPIPQRRALAEAA